MQISRERPEQAERRERVKALRQEEVSCVQRTAKPTRLEHSEQGECGKRQGWREVGGARSHGAWHTVVRSLDFITSKGEASRGIAVRK